VRTNNYGKRQNPLRPHHGIQTRLYGKDINDNICQDSDDGAKWQLDPYNDILLGQLTIKEQGFMNTPTRSHILGNIV